jgi:hypothetical protein
MSYTPQKIDGFGTRYIGAARTVNTSDGSKFVRLTAGEALTKGDVVAIDWTDSTPAYGATVLKVISGTNTAAIAMGVCTETIASGDIGSIQVQGVCTFCKLKDVGDAPGDVLMGSDTAGLATVTAAATDLTFAILIAEDTSAITTAVNTVYLLNPLNY